MSTKKQYLGWIIAALLALVCAIVYIQAPEPVDDAPVTSAAPADHPAAPEPVAEESEEVATLKAEIATLREELAAQESPTPKPLPVPPASDAPETAADEDAEAAAEVRPDPARQERIVNAQLSMVADMTYRPLFDDLQLPLEIRDSMKDTIAAHMLEVQQVTVAAFQSKDQKAKDIHARIEAMESHLRDELAGVLTPEQLAAWDEYDPVADQMLYERLVDGQLNMMAAGLTEENRIVASQVMAEELVREFDLFNASDEFYTMDNFNNAQARALTTSLERLGEALPPDQFDLVDGFVAQAIAMFDAMADAPAP